VNRRSRSTFGGWRAVNPYVRRRRLGWLTLYVMESRIDGWCWEARIGGKWSETVITASGPLVDDLLPSMRLAKRAAEDGVRSLLSPVLDALAVGAP
jgi:hypothetical protein